MLFTHEILGYSMNLSMGELTQNVHPYTTVTTGETARGHLPLLPRSATGRRNNRERVSPFSCWMCTDL